MNKNIILLFNKCMSSGTGLAFSLFVAYTLRGSYLEYVTYTSISFLVVSFTFQWCLHDIVLKPTGEVRNAIEMLLGSLPTLSFLTIIFIYFVILATGIYDNPYGWLLASSFSLFVITTEVFNHITTKLGTVILTSTVSVLKILTILFSLAFASRDFLGISIVLLMLCIVNCSGLFPIIKEFEIRNPFIIKTKINLDIFVRASGFFVAGATTQIDRFFSKSLAVTVENSIGFLVSDYSQLVFGLVFSLIYWKFATIYHGFYKQLLKLVLVPIFMIFIIGCISLFSVTLFESFEYMRLNERVVDSLIIVVSVLPVVLKIYIVDPVLLSRRMSRYMFAENLAILLVYCAFVYVGGLDNAFSLIVIKSLIVSFFVICTVIYIVRWKYRDILGGELLNDGSQQS